MVENNCIFAMGDTVGVKEQMIIGVNTSISFELGHVMCKHKNDNYNFKKIFFITHRKGYDVFLPWVVGRQMSNKTIMVSPEWVIYSKMILVEKYLSV